MTIRIRKDESMKNYFDIFYCELLDLCLKHHTPLDWYGDKSYCRLCILEEREKHLSKLTKKEFKRLYTKVEWDEYSEGIKLKKGK